jgi:hypothetical protein
VLPPGPSSNEPFRWEERDRASSRRHTEWRAPPFPGGDRPEPQRRPGRTQRSARPFDLPRHEPSRPDEVNSAFAAAAAILDNATNARNLSFLLRDAIKENKEDRADLASHAAQVFNSESFAPFGPRGTVTIPKHISGYGALCNMWSKEDVRSKGDAAGRASQKVAQAVVEGRISLDTASDVAVAQLANAFSHFLAPGAAEAYEVALARIADHVARVPVEQLATFEDQNLALLANAFGKVEAGEGEAGDRRRCCDAATANIAGCVANAGRGLPAEKLESFDPQHLAMLANAFGKVVGGEGEAAEGRRRLCDLATTRIADRVARKSIGVIATFGGQNLAMLGNAFIKLEGGGGEAGDRRRRCDEAAANIAACVADPDRGLSAGELAEIDGQDLALLANAFGKVEGGEGEAGDRQRQCDAATARIAARVLDLSAGELAGSEQRTFALLANAFSKLEGDGCREATARIASCVADVSVDDLRRYSPQDISNLADAFARVGGNRCDAATKRLAEHVEDLSRPDLQGYSPQSLANLAGAFLKVGGRRCEAATARIAGYIQKLTANTLEGFDRQSLANLTNAFGHFGGPCDAAMARIAEVVQNLSPRALGSFKPQELANLANGFSKVESRRCEAATAQIAEHVKALSRRELKAYSPQGLALLANAFSKVEGGEGEAEENRRQCDEAIANIAAYVADPDPSRGLPAEKLETCLPQHLAMLANAFVKVMGGEGDAGKNRRGCDAATARIAECVEVLTVDELADFVPQSLAMLGNAFSRVDGGEGKAGDRRRHCDAAMAGIADRVAGLEIEELATFGEQHLALLGNAFSKLEGGEGEVGDGRRQCDAATARIAECVADRGKGVSVKAFKAYEPSHLAMLANAFSKVEGGEGEEAEGRRRLCDLAMARIADRVAPLSVEELATYGSQQLTMLGNAFSKVESGEREAGDRRSRCDAATANIAEYVLYMRADELAAFSGQHLALLGNAFVKVEGGEGEAGKMRSRCRAATARIAEHVDGLPPGTLVKFNSQNLANLANAFSKLPGEIGCVGTTMKLVRQAGQNLGAYKVIHLAQLAGAAGSLLVDAELDADDKTRLAHWFERLSNHLVDAKGRLSRENPRTLATILKALRRADKSADSRLLTGPPKPILERLEALRDAGGFGAANLETMGYLASTLVPLFITINVAGRKPDYPHPLGRRALQLLGSLQPVVAGKLDLLGRDVLGLKPAPGEEVAPGEAHATRIPALSVIQLLRSYEVLASHWMPGVLPGAGKDKGRAEQQRHNDAIRARQAELQGWLKARGEAWQEFIVDELGEGSWDFFAMLADDDLLAGLDAFGMRNAERISQGHAPATFDLSAVLAEMDHEPRPPSGDQGLFSLQTVDPQGRPTGEPQEPRYTILHRFTQGTMRPLAVQMPEKYGPHMLAKTVRHNGVPHRLDTTGGSAMKGPQMTLGSMMAEDADDRSRGRQTRQGGKLLALPWADTLPGTPFLGLLRKLLPYKEAFYYFQRMMRPSPPDIAGLGPHDHVLEGRFPIMVMPDRGPDEEHPFQLTDGDGNLIALRPHDGCGFIKKSIADRMPMMDKVRQRQNDPERRVKAFAEGKPAHLPFQALQQLPRNAAVKAEIGKLLDESLEAPGGTALGGEALHRTVTAARIQGEQAVAVPSSDGRVHVPKTKAVGIRPNQGLLVARSPFEKQNMRPILSDRVLTGDDPTARFLDGCAAIQYTMVGEEDAGRAKDDPMFFAKGVMVVVPDEFWPTEGPAAKSGVVLSSEDTKTHSDWVNRKAREKEDTARPTRGILLAHDFYASGSLVAMPPEEQEKLNGDFDGDTLNLVAQLPALLALVAAFDREEQARNRKPVSMGKTHTPAVNPDTDEYEIGRGRQIVSLLGKVLETFSGLQNNYLALPEEKQVKVAEQALLGSFEGFPPGFRKKLGELLHAEEENRAGGGTGLGRDADETIGNLQRTAEAWLKEAKHPAVKDLAERVSTDLGRWRAERDGAREGEADGGRVALPESVAALLPGAEAEDLKEEYTAAETAAGHLEVLLGFSNRMQPPPDIDYDGTDSRRSFVDLLALGVIVGTDAYKSDTGTRAFGRLAARFQKLIGQHTGGRPPPYAKSTAREIAAGTFDADAALARLASNPTLAADVMEAAIAAAQRAGLLPLSPSVRTRRDRAPTADELRETAVRLQDEAQDHQEEVTAVVRRAAGAAKGAALPARSDGVRGLDSLQGQLRAMAQKGKLDGLEGQPIGSALRFSLVLP